jgi:hypothetical protein
LFFYLLKKKDIGEYAHPKRRRVGGTQKAPPDDVGDQRRKKEARLFLFLFCSV